MTATAGYRFGRFAETALWAIVILADGPRASRGLLDEIRRRGGPIGPGTFFGAITRLEAASLIDRQALVDGTVVYRLPWLGATG